MIPVVCSSKDSFEAESYSSDVSVIEWTYMLLFCAGKDIL